MDWIRKTRNRLRMFSLQLQVIKYRHFWGMDIGKDCRFSSKAILDKTNPKGIHIGDYSGVALGAIILSHDFIRNRYVDTWIGQRCNIGANAVICPGVKIGDGCIIAPGSVVMKDIAPCSLVAGNPARVIEIDIVTGKWGIRFNDIPESRRDPAIIV